MKLLYSSEYFERALFVLEYKEKILMVYRSSGQSGTGHGGQILPFIFLNDRLTLRTPIGYIWKEMLYDGKYITHHKNLKNYNLLEEKMLMISAFVSDIIPVPKEMKRLFGNDGDLQLFVNSINSDMRLAMNGMDFFDLSEDFY